MNLKNVFCTIDTTQPATRALVFRTWANAVTCALIGMVANTIRREQTAVTKRDANPATAEGTGITTYSDMRDEQQADTSEDHPMGTDTKLTLPLLVEWCAAVRALSFTVAAGLDPNERAFGHPQTVKDSTEFMATPRTRVTADQIDSVREEEPELSAEDAVKLIQAMAVEDAAQLAANKNLIIDRVEELLNDAPADRELDTIWNDLPEQYRERLIARAISSVDSELARTLKLAIRGVPGISAKRKILKSDMPVLETLAA